MKYTILWCLLMAVCVEQHALAGYVAGGRDKWGHYCYFQEGLSRKIFSKHKRPGVAADLVSRGVAKFFGTFASASDVNSEPSVNLFFVARANSFFEKNRYVKARLDEYFEPLIKEEEESVRKAVRMQAVDVTIWRFKKSLQPASCIAVPMKIFPQRCGKAPVPVYAVYSPAAKAADTSTSCPFLGFLDDIEKDYKFKLPE